MNAQTEMTEECREAFYEYAKQCGFYDENHCVYADQIRASNAAFAAWKAAWNRRAHLTKPDAGGGEVCSYPDCNCPFDAPADPNWCARGFPHIPSPTHQSPPAQDEQAQR